MFDAQAWYARDVILGRITLPPKAEMTVHSLAWRAKEEKLVTNQEMFEFQGSYIQELLDSTDYPSFDIEGVNRTFLEWKHDKHDDIIGYRNKSYRSLMTGTQSPPHHTPWLSALDDSMVAYLGEPVPALKTAS
jgi:trimethylamine monooxygenase